MLLQKAECWSTGRPQWEQAKVWLTRVERQTLATPELCPHQVLSSLFGSAFVFSHSRHTDGTMVPASAEGPGHCHRPHCCPARPEHAGSSESGLASPRPPHYFFRFSFISFLLLSLFFNFLLCLGSCFVSSFLFLSLEAKNHTAKDRNRKH